MSELNTVRENGLRIVRPLSDDERIESAHAYTALFRDCILGAKAKVASDIHIEPTKDGVVIRHRVHGDLRLWKTLDRSHQKGFIQAAKKLANLDIALSGVPQDGRISFDKWNLDVRVNLLPTIYGEKIVLRLIDLTKDFDISRSGFHPNALEALERATEFDNGVILVSGPTGSGKSTTLYSLLLGLDRLGTNIVTLENPVEYRLGGINQVDVGDKFDFATALRSVLRQDPDVILVGEVRDPETAKLCFQAAATGHLVFSTVHANGAHEVVGRLMNLGIDRETIAENLRFSGAQRLAKRLCPHCCVDVPEARGLSSRPKTRNVSGCPRCEQGITGRIPIMEFMENSHIVHALSERKEKTYGMTLKDAMGFLVEKGEADYHDWKLL